MQEERWASIQTRNCILFLGSGFSIEAKNKEDQPFMDGRSLARRLSKTLGYSADEDISLQDVSDDYIPDDQQLLYDSLLPALTSTKVSIDQERLLSFNWRRVYTTNYDDVVEHCLRKDGREFESFSFESPVKKPSGKTQVIHLHGSIHDCDAENIDERLILTKRSYVRQLAQPQPWFDEFSDDVRFAEGVIFVGYSLSDTPINALLLGPADIRDRTAFVVRNEPDARSKRQLFPYGSIRPIALDGFCQHINEISQSIKPISEIRFSSFVEMNPKKDRKQLLPPTSIEVRNLFLKGIFHVANCAATWPAAKYSVPREPLVREIIDLFKTTRSIVLHSRSGNGKSVLAETLSLALSGKGWKCLRCKPTPKLSEDDQRLLKSTHRAVLFFRNDADARLVVSQISDPRPDLRIVVEVPSSTAMVRANALSRELIQPVSRVDLNKITEQDRSDLSQLLDFAGILPRNHIDLFKGCRDFRDHLLRLYERPQIRAQLLNCARPLWDVPGIRRAMISILGFKIFELDVSPTLKRDVVGEDPAALLGSVPSPLQDVVHDFFEFRDSSIEAFSSIVSEVLLEELLAARDFLDWVQKVATVAARRKYDMIRAQDFGQRFREANQVLGEVLQLSNLRRILRSDAQRDERISDMYESCRHDENINQEPLFWLQFAILRGSDQENKEDLEFAKQFMETAYARATRIPGYRTYQLDTYLMRLLLAIESHFEERGSEVKSLPRIFELLVEFNMMIREPDHRDFVVDVLKDVEPFVLARNDDLTLPQRTSLVRRIEDLVKSLMALNDEVSALSVRAAVLGLQRSISRLER